MSCVMKPGQLLGVIAIGSVLAVSACGSSGSNSAKPTAVSKSSAQATATKVNLATAGLVGYTASANTESSQEKAQDDTLDKCTGVTPESDALLDAKSQNFDKGDTEVSSEFKLQPSSSDVQKDLKAINSDKARSCISTQLTPIIKAISGVTGVTISMSPITEPATGTDGIFGLHALINVTAAGKKQHLSETEIGFGRGNAEMTLTYENAGASAPAAQLNQLRDLLIKRASASVPAGGLTIS